MMSNRNQNLKNNLRGSEKDSLEDYLSRSEQTAEERELENHHHSGGGFRKFIVVAVIILSGMFLARTVGNFSFNPFTTVVSTLGISEPSTDLLDRMNARLIEMGYVGLDYEDLSELRRRGVTATFVTNIRSLGYTDLTLEQAVLLAQSNASTAFMAMMIELGYQPTIEEFIQLRTAGVTAHYSSNVHDLGYRDVTLEQLIRMQRIGVTTSLIERLQSERGDDIPLEDIIRYRISNQ